MLPSDNAFGTRSEVESFIREFEAERLPKDRWTHQAHLVAGFWYLSTLDPDEALSTIRVRIRRHNESVGTPNTDSGGYHETITRLYLRAITDHLSRNKSAAFDESLALLLASPLNESEWPLRYYSRERLFSVEARREWVEPDLHAPEHRTTLNRIDDLQFRPAFEADVPFLLELRRQTMSAHLRASGIEPSAEERAERVMAQFDCAQIVLIKGERVGLLKVAKGDKRWDLIQIQIAPDRQGGGLGTRILQALLAEADAEGARVCLDVLKGNPARGLYERLGFRIVGEDEYSYEMLFGA